ncbi:MAG: diguanylate cyclase (GGDEF)-like protein, partial [Colwellia sp.]
FGAGLTARLGGEEFSVLLHGIDQDNLYNKLDDFRREIAVSTIPAGDALLSITLSVGVVFDSEDEFSKQMNEADNALYLAKENGRNQVVIFGAELED